MSTQVAQDLRAAAEVLRRDGWTQGKYHTFTSGRMCHCVQGALAAVIAGELDAQPDEARLVDDGEYPDSRWDEANRAMRQLVGYNPADWNDAPERTADEVIAALEAAADAAEAAS